MCTKKQRETADDSDAIEYVDGVFVAVTTTLLLNGSIY